MTAYENPILMLFAWAAVAVVIYYGIKYFIAVKWLAAIIGGGCAIGYAASVAIPIIQENQLFQRCLSAHERRDRAAAAPDDYFGRQLRTAAAEEAKNCADLAARKEAAKVTQK
jgi:hypothetical protein